MADIKQAAKWMQEGKKVRRKLWLEIPDLYPKFIVYKSESPVEILDDKGIEPYFTIVSLRGEDWEIYPE